MTKTTEKTKCRIELLKFFDYYVRDIIGDDDVTCGVWLAGGVPDGASAEMLEFIATDEECWMNCVSAFKICCEIEEAEDE